MTKLISTIFILTIILAGQSVRAQDENKPEKRDARAERRSMIEELAEMKKQQARSADVVSTLGAGDAETFGKNVKFLGNGVSGAVYVYRSCDPAILLSELNLTLFPEDRCVVHTGGAQTSAVFDDLGGVTLPARSADNLISYIINSTISNDYDNPHTNSLFTTFIYTPRLTIESAALNDPAAVNPSTGLPLNGSVTFTLGTAGRFETRWIQAGTFESLLDNRSHVATRGLSRSFFADYGLPQSVINNLYRQPMTIRFGMRVQVRNVVFGQYFYSARFIGN